MGVHGDKRAKTQIEKVNISLILETRLMYFTKKRKENLPLFKIFFTKLVLGSKGG